jgi:hypothetical protein
MSMRSTKKGNKVGALHGDMTRDILVADLNVSSPMR